MYFLNFNPVFFNISISIWYKYSAKDNSFFREPSTHRRIHMVQRIPAAGQQTTGTTATEAGTSHTATDAAQQLAAAVTDMSNAAKTLREAGVPEESYAGSVKEAITKVKDQAARVLTKDEKAVLTKEHYKSIGGFFGMMMVGVFGVSLASYVGAGAGNALSRKMFKSDFAPMPGNTPTA